MDEHLVQVDPETHTVRLGAAVTRTTLRRLYGLALGELVSVERVNGVVVSRTYEARPAPPLVLALGGRSGEPGAAAVETDAELAAGKAHGHLAVAVGGGRHSHRARP
jgi:hypothetical protein